MWRTFSKSTGYGTEKRFSISLVFLVSDAIFSLLARFRQSENTRHRTHGARRGSDDSSAGESRLSPQRPAVPPQQSSPNAHQTIPRVNAVKVARGNTEEAISRGARTVRTVAATQGKQKRDEESLPIRVKILERALTNMRSKVIYLLYETCIPMLSWLNKVKAPPWIVKIIMKFTDRVAPLQCALLLSNVFG